MSKPIVSIQCLVYNHASYLCQCLDGFLMQKTDFPFEAIIHDDASTDNSAAIIREYAEKYPDIIKPIYETENQYSKHDGSLRRIMDSAMSPSSKYIALCEGDDYWTDPKKLQKQVDYLESHPDCGLVYTNSKIYHQAKGVFSLATLPRQVDFRGLLVNSPIMTLTSCFRKDYYNMYNLSSVRKSTWIMSDLPLWLYLAAQGPIKYFPDVTSVYRILDNSASHSKEVTKRVNFCMNSYEIRTYFAKEYHCNHLRKQICINHINELFKIAVDADCNLYAYIAKICYKESIFSPFIWFKMLLYSFPMGRKLHSVKYKK